MNKKKIEKNDFSNDKNGGRGGGGRGRGRGQFLHLGGGNKLLPKGPTFKIEPLEVSPPPASVDLLIDKDANCWNMELLHSLFTEEILMLFKVFTFLAI